MTPVGPNWYKEEPSFMTEQWAVPLLAFSTYQSQRILGQTKNRRCFFRTRCLLTAVAAAAAAAAGFSSSNPLQSVSNEVCCVIFASWMMRCRKCCWDQHMLSGWETVDLRKRHKAELQIAEKRTLELQKVRCFGGKAQRPNSDVWTGQWMNQWKEAGLEARGVQQRGDLWMWRERAWI